MIQIQMSYVDASYVSNPHNNWSQTRYFFTSLCSDILKMKVYMRGRNRRCDEQYYIE